MVRLLFLSTSEIENPVLGSETWGVLHLATQQSLQQEKYEAAPLKTMAET